MPKKKTPEEFKKEFYSLDKHKNIELLSDYISQSVKIRCRCKIDGYEWDAWPSVLIHEKAGCPVCAKKVILAGYNDLATKRPDLLKYFVNEEDATKVGVCSNKRVLLKCPDCGYIREVNVENLTSQGFSCPICSDNLSYPNKFLRGLISELKIKDAIFEYSPEWAGNRKYDCYFELSDKKYIIEMDGGFHYQDSEKGRKTRESDKIKNRLAHEHNIEMIRINCEKSNCTYIKEQIKNSRLAQIFNLSQVNWNYCDQNGTSNFAKEICQYYESHYKEQTQTEMAKRFKVDIHTLEHCLKKGYKFGWCEKHVKFQKQRYLNTLEGAKKASAYYQENYSVLTRKEMAENLGIVVPTFNSYINIGIKNGWCKEHEILRKVQKVTLDTKKEICEYFESHLDNYNYDEIAEKFAVSRPTVFRALRLGKQKGWTQHYPITNRK